MLCRVPTDRCGPRQVTDCVPRRYECVTSFPFAVRRRGQRQGNPRIECADHEEAVPQLRHTVVGSEKNICGASISHLSEPFEDRFEDREVVTVSEARNVL